jgi:PAS domain S-box-containing protein
MAAALVAATLLVRIYLYPGYEPLLILFVVPIILSAYFGGVVAGLTATLLASAASSYFLLPPLHSFEIEKSDDLLHWIALLGIGATVTLLVGALHRAGRRLERNRDLLAVTLGSIGDAVIVTDNRGRITFINAEAERMTGWARAETLGQRVGVVFNLMNEQTGQLAESPFDRVLRLGSTVGLENHTVLITRDGREVPIEDSGAPVRQEDGTMHGVVVVFRDSTGRKKAEERAKRLASFPELNPNPVIEVNASGEVTFCNPATSMALEDLGMDKEDCAQFLPEDLRIILENWDKKHESILLREVALNSRVFEETIHLIPQFGVARIYAHDITGRRWTEGRLVPGPGGGH